MTELLLELANVVIPYIGAFSIRFYPMWKTRDVKVRTILTLYCSYTLFVCAGFLAVKNFWTVDLRVMQLYKLYTGLPLVFIPFWIFRKRVWQNAFLAAVSFMYGPISVGFGIYASVNWFADTAYPLLGANLVSLAAIGLTLPPLLFILRRLHENNNVDQTVTWRFIWILPMSFFSLYMLTGNYLVPGAFKGNTFFIIRALLYGALLLTCYLLETAMRQVSENVTLKENTRMTERQLDLQREQYDRFMEHVGTIKSIRHDMRHHLAVMKGYVNFGEVEKLGAYMDELAFVIPEPDGKILCENFAVNAVTVHYLDIAEREGVSVEAQLDIPTETGLVPAMDLCVIMGNFLENAVEACRRMERGDKFIRVHSWINGDALSIVVTNSFDGKRREGENGSYLSRKTAIGEPREGVGLSSVKGICERHFGLAQYEITGDVWKSSALVSMNA